jgi:hypothetical protein
LNHTALSLKGLHPFFTTASTSVLPYWASGNYTLYGIDFIAPKNFVIVDMPVFYKISTMDLYNVDDPVSSVSFNSTASLIQPIMYLVSSALLLGSFALQSVLGRPALQERQSSLDSFIKSESSVAIEQLLCNIGSDGCHSQGVASGVVIASPDTEDPDCK